MTFPVPPHTLADRAAALAGDLPEPAKSGRYKLGTTIMVHRDSIGEEVCNPDLPPWFAAVVVLPPAEPGNWYRWYDPYIWYETEIDLTNGGRWCTEKRNMSYVGKLWHPKWPDCWAIPVEHFSSLREEVKS